MTNLNATGEALLSADDSLSEPARNEYALRCPKCGAATGLHIDGVVAENSAGQRVLVHADGEDEGARLGLRLENGHDHKGRRHQFSLTGWCEHCPGTFSLDFKQHKGMTYFSQTDFPGR